MNKNKSSKEDTIFDYDAQNDSLFVHTPGKKYKSSMEFGNIILDVAEDNSVIGLEILSTSSVFGISKHDARNVKSIETTITISQKSIDLEIHILILKRNSKVSRVALASEANYMNLPAGSELMTVSA